MLRINRHLLLHLHRCLLPLEQVIVQHYPQELLVALAVVAANYRQVQVVVRVAG